MPVKMLFNAVATASLVLGATAIATSPAYARDQIKIVGSSTVFPYTQAVSEEFSKSARMKAPVVESTGTGGGFKAFCQGVGEAHADITGASRAMKKSEYNDCAKNGVTDITEVLIGFDGLSMAVSRKGKALDVTKAQLFQALAAEVEVGGKVVANPYKRWSDIDSKLPSTPIQVFGPPPTSGTRDAWVELVMEEGCAKFPAIKALDKQKHKEVCSRMRQDGPFIEAGENDNLIVQRLESDPTAYGIFGYSFLYENNDKLMAVKVEGVEPSAQTIESASYKVSRPLYFYIKNQHRPVIQGLNQFITEYVSDKSMGPKGYLKERGLVPLADAKRKDVQAAATKSMKMAAPTS
jgi:phosphate transport system substrate-binding protein